MMNPTPKRIAIRAASTFVITFALAYTFFVLVAVFGIDPTGTTGAAWMEYLSSMTVPTAMAAFFTAVVDTGIDIILERRVNR